MKEIDIVIIGGGSAGMAAAVSAKKAGIHDLLILEREKELGGILQQCIHNGFGLQIYREELTGPAFAQKLMDEVTENEIPYKLETTVVDITENRKLTYVNAAEGYVTIQAKAIILACGCYERNRGAISIPGKRPKGVYTAGTAQKYLNIENILVGKKVFILGSGDIGLIMARRMTLEGAKVLGVAELMPYSNGLMRNIVQCLKDYDIPLYLSHTVTDIEGNERLESITISKVDEHRRPIPGTEKRFSVDTLLLSVGLVPENTLAKLAGIKLDPVTKGAVVNEHLETSIPGIYACGNVLHVHDIVDFVTMEAWDAGRFAAMDILKKEKKGKRISVIPAEGISYVLPQCYDGTVQEDLMFSFRVKRPYKDCVIEIMEGDRLLRSIKKNGLLPAEMERVKLKADVLRSAEKKIEFRVRDQL